MIAEQPTKKIQKSLRDAGFAPARTAGSHTMWKCPTGRHHISVPDGHRTISPGVATKVLKTIKGCDC